MKNPKHEPQYFTTLDQIYKERMNALMSTANKHIYNRDYSIDAVQEAFVKAVVYHNKHPDRNFREQIMHVLVIRACRKINKRFSAEIPSGLMQEVDTED